MATILAVRAGGPSAVAAPRALVKHAKLRPAEIVREALEITAGICIYTNATFDISEL